MLVMLHQFDSVVITADDTDVLCLAWLFNTVLMPIPISKRILDVKKKYAALWVRVHVVLS